MNEPKNETTEEQWTSFQKIWTETMSKTMQAAFTFTPTSPPPEVLRQIRSGIFSALAESWEQFLRSPEFLETTRQWMDQAVAFRKTSNDFMGKVRHEMQAPSREDIDTIMLAVRHMEKRLLDRIEQLGARTNGSTNLQRPQRKPAGASRARTHKGSGLKASAAKPTRGTTHHD